MESQSEDAPIIVTDEEWSNRRLQPTLTIAMPIFKQCRMAREKSMKVGVLAVHNEERYLPFCLESLAYAHLDMLIVILDNCTDKSSTMIKCFSNHYATYPVRIINKTWKLRGNPQSDVYNLGFSLAPVNSTIYILAADIVYDSTMFEYKIEPDTIVSFNTANYDLDTTKIRLAWEHVLKSLFGLLKWGQQPFPHGLFACNRELWLRTGMFPDKPFHLGEHNQFKVWMETMKCPIIHVSSVHNYHLREPKATKLSQMAQAELRKNSNVWKILVHSILHFKPYLFIFRLHGDS
jgi:hypothetical protein